MIPVVWHEVAKLIIISFEDIGYAESISPDYSLVFCGKSSVSREIWSLGRRLKYRPQLCTASAVLGAITDNCHEPCSAYYPTEDVHLCLIDMGTCCDLLVMWTKVVTVNSLRTPCCVEVEEHYTAYYSRRKNFYCVAREHLRMLRSDQRSVE